MALLRRVTLRQLRLRCASSLCDNCAGGKAWTHAVVEFALPLYAVRVRVDALPVHLIVLEAALVDRAIGKSEAAVPVVFVRLELALVQQAEARRQRTRKTAGQRNKGATLVRQDPPIASRDVDDLHHSSMA